MKNNDSRFAKIMKTDGMQSLISSLICCRSTCAN